MKAALRTSLMRHLTVTPAGSINIRIRSESKGVEMPLRAIFTRTSCYGKQSEKTPFTPSSHAPLANRPREPPRGSHKSDKSGDTPSARCRLGLVVVYWKNTSLPGNKKGSAP